MPPTPQPPVGSSGVTGSGSQGSQRCHLKVHDRMDTQAKYKTGTPPCYLVQIKRYGMIKICWKDWRTDKQTDLNSYSILWNKSNVLGYLFLILIYMPQTL